MKLKQPPNTHCATPQVVVEGEMDFHVICDAVTGPKSQALRWTEIATCMSRDTANWIRDAAEERQKKGLQP